MSTNRIFFSYSFKDEEKVMEIRRIIESIVDEKGNSKYFVFMASDPIYGNKSGRSWNNQEMQEMLNSFLVVFFLSENSIISDGASQELDFYFHRMKRKAKTRFLYVSLNGKDFCDSLLDCMRNNKGFIETPSIGAAIRRYNEMADETEFESDQLYIDYNDSHLHTRLSLAVNETYNAFHGIDDDDYEMEEYIKKLSARKNSKGKVNATEIVSKPIETKKEENEIADSSFVEIFTKNPNEHLIQNTIIRINDIAKKLKINAEVAEYFETINYVFYKFKIGNVYDINRLEEIKLALSSDYDLHRISLYNEVITNGTHGIVILKKSLKALDFGEMLTPDFLKKEDGLVCALGTNSYNEKKYYDISKMPHCLIAGATCSGKTNVIHTMIVSLLLKYSPKQVRLVLGDPKRVEFKEYSKLPHLLYPIIMDTPNAEAVLKELTSEMEKRYILLANSGALTIEKYNKHAPENEKLPYILLVIDEFSDWILGSDIINNAICSLALKARATGIHIILSTQRPTIDVIDGMVKASFATRIATKCSSAMNSITILDDAGAENLQVKGEVIVSYQGQQDRIQTAYIYPYQLDTLCGKIVEKYGQSTPKPIPGKPKITPFVYRIVDYLEIKKEASLSQIESYIRCSLSRVVTILEKLKSLNIITNKGNLAVLLVSQEEALKIISDNEAVFENV